MSEPDPHSYDAPESGIKCMAENGDGSGSDGHGPGWQLPYVTLTREHEHPILGAYERWVDSATQRSVYVHQLLAIAEGVDPHAVFDRSNPVVIRHANGRRDDNRPENIEVDERPWRDKLALVDALSEYTHLSEIAEAWGCSRPTISEWMDRHGLTRTWVGGTGWVVRDEQESLK